jgi:hypothetical protein
MGDDTLHTWNTRDEDWETLIWAATYPHSTTWLRTMAIDELERRLGSNEAVLAVVNERLAVGIPIGALPAWVPESVRRSNNA